MAAGRWPFRRCVRRGPATTHSLARTSGWRRLPQSGRHKTAKVILGPANSSTTTETARDSNREMIRIIPIGRLLPITTPASRRATCRTIRTGRQLQAMRDSRSRMREIIRTGHSRMCEIIRTGQRLPITPANRRATCRIIRIGRPLPIAVGSRPKATHRGIRPPTMLETGRMATVQLVRGRTAPTLCRR